MALPQLSSERIERFTAVGAWHERSTFDVVADHARRRPSVLAVSDVERRRTYGELLREAEALSTWLLGLELAPGSVVALRTGNSIDIALVHLACARSDLVFVPIAKEFGERELRHLLDRSRARVLLLPTTDPLLDAVRSWLPELEHLDRLVLLDAGSGPEPDLESIVAGPIDPSRPTLDPNVPHVAMTTSGTTGLSRLSAWSDNNLWYFLAQFADAVQLVEDDVFLGLAPASGASTGYVFPVLAPLLHGASSILLPRWEPGAALEALGTLGVTAATAIPTQLIKLLDHPSLGEFDYGSLRVFNNAGAALPADVAAAVEERFGCLVHTCYGASDGGVPAMTRIADPTEKRLTTVGRVLPHTRLLRLDEAMEEVADPSVPGELLWSNPTKSFGYLNDPEMTDETYWGDGFYRSGDLGVIDEDGYVRIVGRRKEMIIRGGRNISPQEVEEHLIADPRIGAVAVIGVPDPVFGERICACVVPAEGVAEAPDLEAVTAWLLDRGLERFKLPERIEHFDDFPMNLGGKTDKRRLRDLVTARGTHDDA